MAQLNFCLDILWFAVVSLLHMRFVGRLTGGHPRGWHIALYFCLLCAIQAASAALSWGELTAVGLEVLALYASARLLLRSHSTGAWTGALLAVYISQLSFGLVNSAEYVLLLLTANRLAVPVVVISSTLTSSAICGGCCRFIQARLSLEKSVAARYRPLLPALFFFFVELYVMQTAYRVSTFPAVPADLGRHLSLLCLQTLGLGALLCTLAIYSHVCRNLQAQAAADSLAQAVRAQQLYTAQARLRYEKTRAFRHDVQNHLSVLSGLLRSGRPDEATAYLDTMSAASSALSFPNQTGEPVVDILLHEKLELANARGIEAEVDLRLPSGCGLDPFDLCVIFANALDNAVAACQTVRGDRVIRITGARQGSFLLLTFENPCRDGPLPPEGTGLANIRTAAEKYRGAVQVGKSGTQFRLSVLLNITGGIS